MIRVLIVDDDKLARKGLTSMMPWKEYGMEVVGDVSNGAKALEFIRNNRVDLMFVDLEMPVMSGIDLIKAIHETYPEVAFVVLTFHENFEYVQTALRLDAIDYISKAELEFEDYDQTLKRIVKKLKEKNKSSAPNDKSSVDRKREERSGESVSTFHWEEIKQEWYNLYWIYDDEIFDSLCDKLINSKMPGQCLEQFLVKLVVMVEMATGFSNEGVLNIEDINDAIRWLENYRESLYLKASQSKDLSKLPVCFLKVISYIREKENLKLREEDVADYINMSRSYFSQSFKKITGITFSDYIKKMRISMAKKLLLESDEPLDRVAQTVGYEDVKHFNQVFYQVVNIKPLDFRKQFSSHSDKCR